MPIEFACECGKAYKVADQYAGKRTKCTACGKPVLVPVPAPAPVEEESAEDAALRAIMDDGGPEPTADRSYAESPPPTPRPMPPPPPRSNPEPYTPKSKKEPPPSYRTNSDPPKKRKPGPNWVKVGGGVTMAIIGLGWFFGAWAVGYIFPYPIAMTLASPFFIIDGFRDRSKK